MQFVGIPGLSVRETRKLLGIPEKELNLKSQLVKMDNCLSMTDRTFIQMTLTTHVGKGQTTLNRKDQCEDFLQKLPLAFA